MSKILILGGTAMIGQTLGAECEKDFAEIIRIYMADDLQ